MVKIQLPVKAGWESFQFFPANTCAGAGIAQFVAPGAVLTQVRFPSAARDFSPTVQESSFSADSYNVCTAPVCNRIHASMYVRMLKIPNAGSHTIIWILRNTVHTRTHIHTHTLWQEGMGSTVLVAAVTLPKESSPHFPTAHIFPQRINEVLKQKNLCRLG